mmetsp:Transcript_97511/g.281360  ORF Transcript_97511/g.281360 Transcript_97511/m.281360 type:complete len:221 (+) Transcript_97511:560-1222(+)
MRRQPGSPAFRPGRAHDGEHAIRRFFARKISISWRKRQLLWDAAGGAARHLRHRLRPVSSSLRPGASGIEAAQGPRGRDQGCPVGGVEEQLGVWAPRGQRRAAGGRAGRPDRALTRSGMLLHDVADALDDPAEQPAGGRGPLGPEGAISAHCPAAANAGAGAHREAGDGPAGVHASAVTIAFWEQHRRRQHPGPDRPIDTIDGGTNGARDARQQPTATKS